MGKKTTDTEAPSYSRGGWAWGAPEKLHKLTITIVINILIYDFSSNEFLSQMD